MSKGNRDVIRIGSVDVPRWLPEKDRDKAQVARSAHAAIVGCCLGSQPWPVVLLGEAGSGKTCAALTVLDTYGGHYRTASEWAEELADAVLGRLRTANGFLITREDVRDNWRKTNLAVLDELGTSGKVSPHHHDAVKWVLDVREGRPLIVISNLTLDALGVLYGDPIASRLSAGTIVTLKGDRRPHPVQSDPQLKL